MSGSENTAYVYVQHVFAGVLMETEEGYAFQYDAAYLQTDGAVAVSLTLPLREEAYTSKTLFSFFDGLIPEGWMLQLAAKNWKKNPRDRFAILRVACRDCVGDVSVREVME